VIVETTCRTHQWTHASEPCPYCRETKAEQRHSRPRQRRDHQPKSANAKRADRLSDAITATIRGDASKVQEWFTHDVVGTGPAMRVRSRAELASEIRIRRGAFTDIEIAFSPLDVSGPQACVEWVASAVHEGPLVLDETRAEAMIPSGRRVRVRAVTVAEFEGDQISSFRSYWDDLPVLADIREAKSR
jgi:ketosteroid isomerase-like protein